jgi:hypothetical protein
VKSMESVNQIQTKIEMDPHKGKFKKNTVVLDSSQYNSSVNVDVQTQNLIEMSLAKANQLDKVIN